MYCIGYCVLYSDEESSLSRSRIVQPSTIVGHEYVRLTVCVKRLLGTLWEYSTVYTGIYLVLFQFLYPTAYADTYWLSMRVGKNIKNQSKEKFCARAKSG